MIYCSRRCVWLCSAPSRGKTSVEEVRVLSVVFGRVFLVPTRGESTSFEYFPFWARLLGPTRERTSFSNLV